MATEEKLTFEELLEAYVEAARYYHHEYVARFKIEAPQAFEDLKPDPRIEEALYAVVERQLSILTVYGQASIYAIEVPPGSGKFISGIHECPPGWYYCPGGGCARKPSGCLGG